MVVRRTGLASEGRGLFSLIPWYLFYIDAKVGPKTRQQTVAPQAAVEDRLSFVIGLPWPQVAPPPISYRISTESCQRRENRWRYHPLARPSCPLLQVVFMPKMQCICGHCAKRTRTVKKDSHATNSTALDANKRASFSCSHGGAKEYL